MRMTGKKARRGRAGRGAVLLIAVLLFSSSGMRIATGMGAAFASNAVDGHAIEAAPDIQEPQAMAGKETHAPSARIQMARPEMASLLETLKERETRADQREKQIALRSKALAIADQEIEKRLVALQQAEDALRATLALANTAAEDDLANLTTVYENMKPKDAAALFEKMDPNFAAGFLGRMRPDAAAAVLAGLSPDKAYSVSVILAGRNADVPKT